MLKSHLITICLLTVMAPPLALKAQMTVKGQVFDLTTSEPIDYCNVFIVGTTIGAPTDSTGSFTIEVNEPGSYELVFSHVAYRPEIIELTVENEPLVIDPMPLSPDTRYVEEVVVTGKKDRSWQRLYDRFVNYAMGKHFKKRLVEITNPYVVEFKQVGKGMLAEAQPFTLNIRNDFTGYEVSFMVQRVFLSKSNQFMVGYPGFKPLSSENPGQMDEWQANRLKSYQGSLRHIFQSLLKNELEENGFDTQLTEKDPKKIRGPASRILPVNTDETVNLNKQNLFKHVKVTDTDNPRIKKISWKGLLKVTCLNEQDSFGKPQLTFIEAIEGEVLAYTNGIPVKLFVA